jgi:hypothetical protein
MATIKTQLVDGQRRIITKVVNGQRRISCSCCGCCMYPATAYTNELYSFDDLPDEVEFWHNDGEGGALVGPIILPKNGSAGEFFYGGETDLSPRISHFTDEWLVGVNQIDPGLGDCLILDKLTIEPAPAAGDGTRSIWVFDRFEDTYSFTAPDAAGTLARESLCVWRGDGRSLTFVISNTFVGWTLGGVRKEGVQNTPVGNYGSAQIS